MIYVRVGRGIVALAVNQVGGPFDRSLETRLVRTVSDRLAAGLKGAPVIQAADRGEVARSRPRMIRALGAHVVRDQARSA